MPDVIKIGLTGRMKSGKGVVKDYLVNRHGFRSMAFAEPVKMASVAAINAALRQIGYGGFMTLEVLDRDKSLLRGMPQFIGTDLGRNYLDSPGIWIDMLVERVGEWEDQCLTQDDNVRVVVDDCRFLNEADALRTYGFSIVKIVRPYADRLYSIISDLRSYDRNLSFTEAEEIARQKMEHESEREVDLIKPDFTLPNQGSVDELLRSTYEIASKVKGGGVAVDLAKV